MDDAMDAKEAPVQSAKDTFYEVLRGRLAGLNPERTVVVRGVSRPGLMVVENELVSAVVMPDCFRMQWVGSEVDAGGALPLVTMECALAYETAGTAMNAGMDRGRMLAAMDAELAAAVSAAPQSAVKVDYSGLAFGGAAVTMQTKVWWGSVTFGKTMVKEDRVGRTATVRVMSYQEAGEL